MEFLHQNGNAPDFGDRLNGHLWAHVLSEEARAASDALMVGSGSLLTAARLERYVGTSKRVVVLGSGVSYDGPPSDVTQFFVAGLRGPLSAAIVGMPGAAITDAAILVAAIRIFAPHGEASGEVLFIPHRCSLRKSPWPDIARKAGLSYLDPQADTIEVVRRIARAKLVVTESMHAAIVADAMRVPWVPVVINPAVDEFRWRDWTRSMDLPYRPVKIGAGAGDDRFDYRIAQRNLRRVGIPSHATLERATTAEEYREYLRRRFGKSTAPWTAEAGDGQRRDILRRPVRIPNSSFADDAAHSLARAAKAPAFLSTDRMFQQRMQQMLEASERVEDYLLHGLAPVPMPVRAAV